MPVTTKYVFIASMDITPEKEALLNEVYDTEHVPALLKVPGVISVTRGVAEPFIVSIGGEERSVAVGDEPKYSAVYEIESPDVLVSDAWAAAVEAGRWPEQVRPFTSNRRQVLRRVVETGV
ncbi:MAG: hypothetical protein O7A62_03060 [Alphaproteobacteria bacterium]|nr:hypothetical protein [Alphaproteobacteria bacterium]